MSFNRLVKPIIVGAALLIASCNTANTHIGDEDRAFGEAVKYDQAIQTVNPMPFYPPTAAKPGDSGAKGQTAVKRYRTDAVKQVEAAQTTSGSSSGSGMSSSSH